MNINNILIPFSIFLIFSLPSPSSSEKCNPQDKKVLLQIKKDLNNPYHLASWDPKTDCCDWYVVDCDRKTNRISSLHIFQANITGQIPAAVGNLPFLETLQFHHVTNLTGTIPESVTKLKKLTYLTLSNNNLSGPIPSFLGKIKSLIILDLSFNSFSGSIPASLSQLPTIVSLHLDRNKLTGSIPESFGKFPGITPPLYDPTISLYLSHNQLTGEVPKSLANVNWGTLDFSRNKLVGDVSFLFGTNKTLYTVDLSRNLFEFNLSKIEVPKGLTNFDVNHNKIFGNLPVEMTELSLQFFNVSYNRLCGEIPVGGRLQSYEVTDYFHNRCLCGAPLPACK